jgi:hypothetical protein
MCKKALMSFVIASMVDDLRTVPSAAQIVTDMDRGLPRLKHSLGPLPCRGATAVSRGQCSREDLRALPSAAQIVKGWPLGPGIALGTCDFAIKDIAQTGTAMHSVVWSEVQGLYVVRDGNSCGCPATSQTEAFQTLFFGR